MLAGGWKFHMCREGVSDGFQRAVNVFGESFVISLLGGDQETPINLCERVRDECHSLHPRGRKVFDF